MTYTINKTPAGRFAVLRGDETIHEFELELAAETFCTAMNTNELLRQANRINQRLCEGAILGRWDAKDMIAHRKF